MFDALGVVRRVTGVGNLAFTANQAILDAAAAGQLIEFAVTGAIDVELVIDAAPDMFMTGGGDDTAYAILRDAGIPVIANAEWLEPTLLGRAEWIKYVALYFDAEALAAEMFDDIERSYLDAAAAVGGVAPEDRPLVLAGSPFQGVFYAPGGRSFTAQTIADAGARYVFAGNDETPSLAFPDLEPVLDAAAEAEFWINASFGYRTLADIEADEPRLAALPPVQAGQVWNYDLLTTESGGVGFFELGVLRPDLVLRDLIEIFHPGTLPGHEFTFYRQVGAE
jgi:iron complex transport system substrate-binding protein